MRAYRFLEKELGRHTSESIRFDVPLRRTGVTTSGRRGYFNYVIPQSVIVNMQISETSLVRVTKVIFGTCGHMCVWSSNPKKDFTIGPAEVSKLEVLRT